MCKNCNSKTYQGPTSVAVIKDNMTNQTEALKRFDEEFGTNQAFIVKQGMILSGERQMMLSDARSFLLSELNKRDEEWKKVLEGMPLEEKKTNQAVDDCYEQPDYDDIIKEGYNKAIEELKIWRDAVSK